MARQPYPSDLTKTQWRLVAPLIPPVRPGGRPRKYDIREVINGILYVNREGCRWRALPHDLPHWKPCYNFFRAFAADGTWDRLVTALRVEVRTKLGRDPTPSGACIDSQSAKTAHGGAEVGVDGGKMVRGRKRHIVTDTLGLLLVVLVTAANRDDGTTAPELLAELRAAQFPRLEVVWADAKYRNDTLAAWLGGQNRLRVEVTTRPDGQKGFHPLPKRWVVEQTFAGLIRSRRLVRGFERLPTSSATMVKVSGVPPDGLPCSAAARAAEVPLRTEGHYLSLLEPFLNCGAVRDARTPADFAQNVFGVDFGWTWEWHAFRFIFD